MVLEEINKECEKCGTKMEIRKYIYGSEEYDESTHSRPQPINWIKKIEMKDCYKYPFCGYSETIEENII